MDKIQSKSVFKIITSMGRSNDWKKLNLSSDQIETLNNIGYGSEKKYGHGAIGLSTYLNNLDSNTYEVKMIQADHGDFTEIYEVTMLREIDHENNEYTGYLRDILKELEKFSNKYVTVIVNDATHILEEKRKQSMIKYREELLEQVKIIDEKINNL